jgi:hypothetical protein
MVFDTGALPHSQEAETPEPPVLKNEPSAKAKAAETAQNENSTATKEQPPVKDDGEL